MKFIDVVELTKSAVAQSLGNEYMEKVGDLSALDSYKLVDIGKDVLDGGTVDSYVKSLLTQIGKLYIESREYVSELNSIYIDSFDWGGYLERVYFAPQDLVTDEMFNLVNGNSYDDHKFYKPNVSAKIFEESKTIMCPISLTEDAVKMAFSSWDEMNKFLSGIQQNVRNTIDLGLDAYAHMLVSCAIAVSDKALNNSIHLLTEAKEKGIVPSDTTSEQALNNEAYLVYCLNRIRNVEKYMHRMTTAYNNGSVPMQAKDVNKILLTDFVSSTKFNVRANTYNLDEVGIGSYDEVSAWQGITDGTTNFDYANNSKIMITADPTNKLGIGTSAVTLTNAIGLLFDRMALGICPYRSKVTSNYTAIADFWNEYHHMLVNYILDSNYSMVAFFND